MATLLGFSAIAMWSFLALLTALSGDVPPFQLSAMTFAIGTIVGLVALRVRGGSLRVFKQRPVVWALGVAGLFGYHALYFSALRSAPPADASLIAFLWPLFIVLGSAALPGERLRWFHIVGAVLGLSGATLIIAGGGSLDVSADYALGYALALLCAVTWAAYSLLSRRVSDVPSDVVAGFCLATAILSAMAHWAFETTIWPDTGSEWMAVLGLGLMPVGAAFYVWDYAVKNGDIQLIGAASYAAPLLSILILVIAGETEANGAIVLAAILITGGACLAALPLIRGALRRP